MLFTIFAFSLFGGCFNDSKKAAVIVSSQLSVETCLDIEAGSDSYVRIDTAAVEANEGDTVVIKAYTDSYTIGTISFTTRMTNSCEDEINYYVSVNSGGVTVQDDYFPVDSCQEEESATEETDTLDTNY